MANTTEASELIRDDYKTKFVPREQYEYLRRTIQAELATLAEYGTIDPDVLRRALHEAEEMEI